VLGNLVGTLVLAIGLLRSRAVPLWAAIAIGLWPPLHVIGLVFFGNEVPQVIGAVLQALGFGGCGIVLATRSRSVNVAPIDLDSRRAIPRDSITQI
jgi:hypothetical protein